MIDLVICTYNRPEKVRELTLALLDCQPAPNQIIVVDSSDTENQALQNSPQIQYIRSSHKNQPFQRFLGTQLSNAEYILFLDDDMEIQNPQFLEDLKIILSGEVFAGIALNFKDKHSHTTLSEVPKSQLFAQLSFLRRFKNWFTAYPQLSEGKFGFCGNRGKQPTVFKETEYLSGGAFIGRRKDLFQNFNFQLFDLFEKRMGMGEDGIIGYGLHKRGKLMFLPEIYFLHNDQRDSSYSMDIRAFAEKVIFSRLYLSLERQRLNEGSLLFARLHFHWYAFWRMAGLVMNYLIRRNSKQKSVVLGTYSGWKKAFGFRFQKPVVSHPYWEQEMKSNLESHGAK